MPQLMTTRPDVKPGAAPSLQLSQTHLHAMVTDIGIWQHTRGRRPDKRRGYSIDDVARALIVAVGYRRRNVEQEFASQLAESSLRYIERAAILDGENRGRYHNFSDESGRWLDDAGSDDSFGRTVWGLGVAYAEDAANNNRIQYLLDGSLPLCGSLQPLRSRAFAILGLDYYPDAWPVVRHLADGLANEYRRISGPGWRWFENYMTYCNARLPHALFIAAARFPENRQYLQVAVESLDFLLACTHNYKGGFSPVGNAPLTSGGWFNRGDKRPPLFDQQPVDAGALVECCAVAYRITSEPRFRSAAYGAYGWYFGDNVHGLSVYDPVTGGVHDALTEDGLNDNMGAESVLSVHLARQALDAMELGDISQL